MSTEDALVWFRESFPHATMDELTALARMADEAADWSDIDLDEVRRVMARITQRARRGMS